MDDALRCFYLGHEEDDQGRYEYVDEVYLHPQPRLVARKEVYCGRCDKNLGFYAEATPPEDEPHRVKVLTRTNIVSYDNIYYASCWCGWKGKEYISWFSAYDEQLEHLDVPYIEKDIEEPDGYHRL